jgi:uncharacterized OsmC-like protein
MSNSTSVARTSREAVRRSPTPDICVRHRGRDRFDIETRGHVVTVDQPHDAGGEDLGPTPTELFVASVASCVAFYARRYLARHHIDPGGLSVRASYHTMAKPARVDEIDISIDVPAGLPAIRRDALLAVASHCTVHNSLTTPPRVGITFADEGGPQYPDDRVDRAHEPR